MMDLAPRQHASISQDARIFLLGLPNLEKTPGLNAATAKLVYDFFHERGGG
jgi:hypothetical protein